MVRLTLTGFPVLPTMMISEKASDVILQGLADDG